MTLQRPVTLSTLTYAVLWTAEDLGDQHPALFVPLHRVLLRGRTLQVGVSQAATELEVLGLLDRRVVHPELLDTLRLLARPEVECYGWISDPQHPNGFSAAAVAADDRAVLGVLDGNRLSLSPVRAAGVADALLALLAPVPAAIGSAVNLAAAELTPTPTSPDDPVFTGLHRAADPALAKARALVAAPRTGAAQLYTVHRDRLGRRHAALPITVIDTDTGRWSFRTTRSTTGEAWITAAPATVDELAAQLRHTEAVAPSGGT